MVPNGWPNVSMPIESYGTSVLLINFLEVAKRIFASSEINEPIAVTAHWQNCKPSYLQWGDIDFPDEVFHWSEPSLTISLTVSDLDNPNAVAKDFVDRLFNAYRQEGNPHFDNAGNFQLRRLGGPHCQDTKMGSVKVRLAFLQP